MPRKKRLHIKNSIYHVMSRGNRKANIFLDADDKNVFISYLQDNLQRFDHAIMAFCLMNNHFHLALKIRKDPLDKVMHQLLSRYSKYFNAKYKMVGHCFQGRYLDKCVHDEKYLFDLCKYIHLNPVRASMVKNPRDYYWSSHCEYLVDGYFPWVSCDLVFERLSNDALEAREKYREFMALEAEYPNEVLFEFSQVGVSSSGECVQTEITLSQLVKLVADEYKQTPIMLAMPGKCSRRSEARAVVGYLAQKYRLATVALVAAGFHRSATTQSRAILRLKQRMKSCGFLTKRVKNIEKTMIYM